MIGFYLFLNEWNRQGKYFMASDKYKQSLFLVHFLTQTQNIHKALQECLECAVIFAYLIV